MLSQQPFLFSAGFSLQKKKVRGEGYTSAFFKKSRVKNAVSDGLLFLF
jgi:hypothetical protein